MWKFSRNICKLNPVIHKKLIQHDYKDYIQEWNVGVASEDQQTDITILKKTKEKIHHPSK